MHSDFNGPTSESTRLTRIASQPFSLDSRYEIEDVLGIGAYGVVVKAIDASGKVYAIKRMDKTFDNAVFAKRALRELKIQRVLKHPNILNIISVQLPSSYASLDELYVFSEYMESDLSKIIKSSQALTDEHCQLFLYQILLALQYMHSASILHRDLKPRNILINSDCEVKICDFGLARYCEQAVSSAPMTDYVSTRWYRPPELLFGSKFYDTAMDVWSVGTILGEIITRKPMFPGKDAASVLNLIFKTIGVPSDEDLKSIKKAKVNKNLYREPPSLQEEFREANPNAIDLLRRMLEFNPKKRITIEECLAHPYLSNWRGLDLENRGERVSAYDFEFEKMNLEVEDYKNMIFEEILLYHSQEKLETYNINKSGFNS